MYETASRRLDLEAATATESRPWLYRHDLRSGGGHGQRIADHLARVAAAIAPVVGDHNSTQLVTDLLDRADIPSGCGLCADPTSITAAPLTDDTDIVATLNVRSAVALVAAAARWVKELVNLDRSSTTTGLLIGVTHDGHVIRMRTRMP
jgi:hypothetical protein